jgi:preprotein translocase subunit SecD
MQTVWIRFSLIAAMVALGAYILVPSVSYFRLTDAEVAEVRENPAAFDKHVPSWAPRTHLVPGLDLQGGVQLVLGVDLDKAISDRARRTSQRMHDELDSKKVDAKVDHLVDEGKGDRVRAVFADEAALKTYTADIADHYPDLAEVSASGLTLVWRVHPDVVTKIKTDAVGQTMKTIGNRVDKLHVTQPIIERRGDSQVSVQLPGFANPEQAKALIGRTAQLEFQMCDDENDFLTKLDGVPAFAQLQTNPFQRKNGSMAQDAYLEFTEDHLTEIRAFLNGKAPSGRVIKYGKGFSRPGEPKKLRTFTLYSSIELTGDDLSNAEVMMGTPEQPSPAVSIEFSPVGKQIFADLTTKNVGKRMAIVLEDFVDSAPVINEPITGGNASIAMGGGRTMDEQRAEANGLAVVLKSGALPAPVSFREERTVGPSLGADSVKAAWQASFLGAGLVVLFMLIVYKVGGLIASICVLLNIFFVLVTLSFIGGTISLPSIAGILLTIGMAVDSNVIINERIREEFLLGKTVNASVEAGYASAFTAIFDANMTTAIAGVVCLTLGSGPVQEFATTLLIGIVTTMFTAVFVSRTLFEMYVGKGKETISI